MVTSALSTHAAHAEAKQLSRRLFLVRDGAGVGGWCRAGRLGGAGTERSRDARRFGLRAEGRAAVTRAKSPSSPRASLASFLGAQNCWTLSCSGSCWASATRRRAGVAKRWPDAGAPACLAGSIGPAAARAAGHTPLLDMQDHCWKCKVAGNARLQPSSRDLGRARAEAWGDGRRGALSPGCIDAHQRTTRRARHPSHALRRTFTGRVRGERARLAISSGAAALAHGGRGWALRCRSACRACPGIFSSWRCALRGRRPATRGRHSRVVAHGGLFLPRAGRVGVITVQQGKGRTERRGLGIYADRYATIPTPSTDATGVSCLVPVSAIRRGYDRGCHLGRGVAIRGCRARGIRQRRMVAERT